MKATKMFNIFSYGKKAFVNVVNNIIDKEVKKRMYEIFSKEEERKTKERILCAKLTHKIGDIVIVCGNEWDDISVGEIVDYIMVGDTCIPLFEDYISGENLSCIGLTRHYTKELLDMLLMFNPFERWHLLAKNDLNSDILKKDHYKPDLVLKTPDEVKEILKSKGIY